MKSTIPEGIVEFLQLQEKDELEWTMDTQYNKRVAMVKKKTTDREGVELARFAMKQKKRNKKQEEDY